MMDSDTDKGEFRLSEEDNKQKSEFTRLYDVQEVTRNRQRDELCCGARTERYSTQLPHSSSLLLSLTTLKSISSTYTGRELVFVKTKKTSSHCVTSLDTPTMTSSSSTGRVSRERNSSTSSHRSNDSNQFEPPTHHLGHPERQFSNTSPPPQHLRHPPHPPPPTSSRKHSSQIIGQASSNSNAQIGQSSSNSNLQSSIIYATHHAISPPPDTGQQPQTPALHDSNGLQQTTEQGNVIAGAPLVVYEQRLQSSSTGTGWEELTDAINGAAECLHAQDYGQMRRQLSQIKIEDANEEMSLALSFGLGQANMKLKNLTQAETHFTALTNQARTMGDRWRGDQSIAHYYLGEINYIRGKFDEAARHYRMALDFHSRLVSVAKKFKVIPPSQSGLWSKLAAALRNGSRVVDAISAYREAIAAATLKKDKLAAHTSLGNLLQNSGENAQAVEEYKCSIQLSEELEDNVSLGWANGNIGNAYLGLGYRDKAIYHLKEALELTLKHEPTPSAIGRAYNNIGTAYQALNELDKAQEYYDLSLAQAIYGADTAGQARVYGNIGNLQMLLKKYDGSIAHYTETLSTTKDKATKVTAYHNRGCAYYEKSESEKRKYYVKRFGSQIQGGAGGGSQAAVEREAGKLYSLTFHGREVERVVEEKQKLPNLSQSVQKWYKKAVDDLSYVVKQHELSFMHTKGSRKGLTLSVSLFETNARTFHRLLDSHYNLGQWEEKALVVAEQSRARTLGELLLERKRGQLDFELETPLDVRQIDRIVGSQSLDVVMVSYTGSRLLVWVLSPGERRTGEDEREVRHAMFQVSVEEDEFDGKSLDYYLHYLLSEELVEKNVEMYAYSDYTSEQVAPIVRLHKLFAEPLLKVLSCLHPEPRPSGHVQDVIFIPDSYINLLPLVALFDKTSQEFLGDAYRFRTMPSLLSLGILDQMPPVQVHIPRDGNKFCVVGNPSIPAFSVKGKTWSLGKLPFATEEAEWVSYILGCKPTLHEQATKSVVMMMVAGARMIHIATHGSAASGFLAFASLDGAGSADPVDEKSVLIYPEDIEKMVMAPALVVLSSCDSGRGTVKADGVLGMARAFILAGAQAVMTTLWRVPDESAAVFMKFFYQFLVDGHSSTTALQKAVMSMRSFVKYSGFVHWSGYTLTGREVRIVATNGEENEEEKRVKEGIGGEEQTIFPRLDIIQLLEKSIVENIGKSSSAPPTDVQVVYGSHGLSPAVPVKDFVQQNYRSFSGGVYWLNSRSLEFLNGGLQLLHTVCLKESPEHVLIVLDDVRLLPQSDHLRQLLKYHTTHIIIISHTPQPSDTIKREIDQQLIRGWTPIQIQPLSTVHTTQRIVHSIISRTHFTPLNREQKLLEKIASLTAGCPGLVALTNTLLQQCQEEIEQDDGGDGEEDLLMKFSSKIQLSLEQRPPRESLQASSEESRPRSGSSRIDQYISQIISAFQLPPTHLFVLRTLSVFSPQPLPHSLVDIIQYLAAKATQGNTSSTRVTPNSITNLLSTKLVRSYPSPIVSPPIEHSSPPSSLTTQQRYLYVPQLVQDSLWNKMTDTDKVFSITTGYRALLELTSRASSSSSSSSPPLYESELYYAAGLTRTLIAKCDTNRSCINEDVYREICKMLVSLQLREVSSASR